jgi:hypothetical protein
MAYALTQYLDWEKRFVLENVLIPKAIVLSMFVYRIRQEKILLLRVSYKILFSSPSSLELGEGVEITFPTILFLLAFIPL